MQATPLAPTPALDLKWRLAQARQPGWSMWIASGIARYILRTCGMAGGWHGKVRPGVQV